MSNTAPLIIGCLADEIEAEIELAEMILRGEQALEESLREKERAKQECRQDFAFVI